MFCKLSFDAPYIRHIRAYNECLSWVANTFFCAVYARSLQDVSYFSRIKVTQLFNFLAVNVLRLLMCFRDIFYQSPSPSLKRRILFSGLEFIIYITSVISTQSPRNPTWISRKIIFPTRDIMNPRPATFRQTPTVSPAKNDVWGTTAEIPYWWRVTTHIWAWLAWISGIPWSRILL